MKPASAEAWLIADNFFHEAGRSTITYGGKSADKELRRTELGGTEKGMALWEGSKEAMTDLKIGTGAI